MLHTLQYLLYVLKLLIIARATSWKTPNMGKIQAKRDQFPASVGGYKWSQKSAIFGMVKEKGLTWSVTCLEFWFKPQVYGKYCRKEEEKTFEKQLNCSETCTCIFDGYHGCTCKVGRTNIDALATGHNHCTFIHCNANAWFRVFCAHEDHLVFGIKPPFYSTARMKDLLLHETNE